MDPASEGALNRGRPASCMMSTSAPGDNSIPAGTPRRPGDATSRPARRRVIYLANPLGFAESGRHALGRIRAQLEGLGVDVWEPFAECAGRPPRDIGRLCLEHIRESDGVFAVVNGNPPDEGVMVEIGYAFALGKPVFLFRDDIRTCADTPDYPLNLMIYAGLPEEWRDHWYTDIGEVADGSKALARWAGA